MKSAVTKSFDEFLAKGIFILPKEANVEIWKSISKAGGPKDISRHCGKVPVNYSVYERLIGGKWLNDEGINAYISLMGQRKGTFVSGTYVFQKLFGEKNAIGLQRQVRD